MKVPVSDIEKSDTHTSNLLPQQGQTVSEMELEKLSKTPTNTNGNTYHHNGAKPNDYRKSVSARYLFQTCPQLWVRSIAAPEKNSAEFSSAQWASDVKPLWKCPSMKSNISFLCSSNAHTHVGLCSFSWASCITDRIRTRLCRQGLDDDQHAMHDKAVKHQWLSIN